MESSAATRVAAVARLRLTAPAPGGAWRTLPDAFKIAGAMATAEIEDVSDTALWVAAYRARESESANPLFRDPLAARLAGERGLALGRTMPGGALVHWSITLRTVGIDRLVESAVRRGVDTVVNIGAGLDTRPYRLELPPALRWVELDFPKIVELKERKLKDERPVCSLERVALDVTDRPRRTEILARVTAGSACTAVITEGVLPYLYPADVDALVADVRRIPPVRYWIQEYYNKGGLRSMPFRPWKRRLMAAPIRFGVEDWFSYFRERGFRVAESTRVMDEAERVKRRPPVTLPMLLGFLLMSRKDRATVRDRMGYALFEREDAAIAPSLPAP